MSFDFLNHCRNCPSSTTHCCTKKGNIVLINEDEKVQIQAHFDNLKNELQIENLDTYTLFNEAETQNGVTPLKLISTKDPDSQEDIDRCPFFVKPFCKLHNLGKPLDCKLWPVAKFENGDRRKVHVDISCFAINAKDEIPTSTVQESVDLFNSLDSIKKQTYYSQSNSHYTLKEVPIKIWGEFQRFKAIYKTKLDDTIDELNNDLGNVEDKFVGIDFKSKEVLFITKWVIGIFFASIFASLLNQSVGNVENFKVENLNYISHFKFDAFFTKLFQILSIAFITIIFIFDTYRIIIPLPWIIKDYAEEPFDFGDSRVKFKDKNLPNYQVTKFAVIGLLSFVLLNIMAIKFVYEPIYYLSIYGIIMGLDLGWYYINKKRLDTIIHLLKLIIPILFVLMFCAISELSLTIPLLLSLASLILYFLFNYMLKNEAFPIEWRRLKITATILNKLYFHFSMPSVETEKERIRLKIQNRCSDEIFKNEEASLRKYAEDNNQSVDSVIEIFKHEKTKLIELKNGKLKDLGEKISIAQECEKYIDKREKELASEFSFKFIAWLDFLICILPPLVIILNTHYFKISTISDNIYLILSISFFLHSGLMFYELFKNKFYKDYLNSLFIKS